MKKKRKTLAVVAGLALSPGLQGGCQEQSRNAAQKLPGFVVRNQADVEALSGQIDELSPTLAGHLMVRNAELPSLEGLPLIGEIEGELRIADNHNLQSLQGLEDLRSISGSLIIKANQQLVDFRGLEGIQRLGGSLFVQGNGVLESIAVLEQLRFLLGDRLMVQENGQADQQAGELAARLHQNGYAGTVNQ
ncbi:MAG: hypothetical protein GKR89_00320 [Candidatus Latescibacteria bacterium]|nr:hypothetical protein [Candidatus Latescibacterota bacterium]